MDERLIPADARDVARMIARAYLSGPNVTADLGDIRLAPHQVEAASRIITMLEETGGAVLADATGLGKTFVAIAVMRAAGPALVVAPAALRGMWRDALRRTRVGASITTYEAMSRGSVPVAERAALIVLDEAHHARNPRSRRFDVLADLAWGSRVLLLTATPIHNRGRDLRALLSLFLGSRALAMNDTEALRFIVRRTWVVKGPPGAPALPRLRAPRWLAVPSDSQTLDSIRSLPEPVPTADGTVAHALLVLGLIRAWSSSEAALRSMLRRRLLRAAALTAALESGRLPNRKELAGWPIVDSSVQLGFPDFFPATATRVDTSAWRASLERHCEGVRAILHRLDENGGAADASRTNLLSALRSRHPAFPIVAFTQFADTAQAYFRAAVSSGGVAMVTGRGGHVASGKITADEVVRGFDIGDGGGARPRAMPLDLLIATDVLSEGLSLRRAGAIVHLDLPWTMARLEQRVGRLRRIGSPHDRIDVYAIGPPVTARELTAVVRALQRKVRLSSSLVGTGSVEETMPLLGQRLARATKDIGHHDEAHAGEELRQALSAWEAGDFGFVKQHRSVGGPGAMAALALVSSGSRQLVAIGGDCASTSRVAVLRAVRVLSACLSSDTSRTSASRERLEHVVAATAGWLEQERGRTIAEPATDAPSLAHATVLRELQQMVASADRTRRGGVAEQVARCRSLVLASRGVGAELALERLLASTKGRALDVDALEDLLADRVRMRPRKGAEAATIEALLLGGGQPGCSASAFQAPSAALRMSDTGTAATAVPVTTRQATSL